MYQEHHGNVDDWLLYGKMAEAWNLKVYGVNIRIDPANELALVPMTAGMVCWHYDRCDQWGFQRRILKDLKFMDRVQEHLEGNAIFYRTTDAGETQFDVRKFDKWGKIYEMKLKGMTLLKSMNYRDMNPSVGSKRKQRFG